MSGTSARTAVAGALLVGVVLVAVAGLLALATGHRAAALVELLVLVLGAAGGALLLRRMP